MCGFRRTELALEELIPWRNPERHFPSVIQSITEGVKIRSSAKSGSAGKEEEGELHHTRRSYARWRSTTRGFLQSIVLLITQS